MYSTGKLSGKLYRKGAVWTMSASGFTSLDDSTGNGVYAVTLENGKKKATAELQIVRPDMSSDLSVYDAFVEAWNFRFSGLRSMWKTGDYPAFAKTCLYGHGVTLTGADYGLYDGERIKLSFGTDGSVKAAATFVIGTAKGKTVTYTASASAIVMSSTCEFVNGEWKFGGECYLYFPVNKKKSFAGYLCHVVLSYKDGQVTVSAYQ